MSVKPLLRGTALCLLACVASGALAQTLNHVVLVWLKDPGNEAQVEAIVDHADSLTAIPGVLAVTAGRSIPSDRKVVDDSFTVGLNILLRSADDIAAYLEHPIHRDYVKTYVDGKAEKLLIYDFYTGEQ